MTGTDMDTDRTPSSLSSGIQLLDVVSAVVDVGKRVLLYCSPSAAVIVLFPRFDDPHYRALAIALAVLVAVLSAWSIAARPAEEDLFVTLLSAWFYNMTVFGATVFGAMYAASPVRFVFLLGFPLAGVEFRRHLGGTSD